MHVSRLTRKMRLTSQMLKSCSSVPFDSTEYLDLSNKSIVCLDSKLALCPKLSHLFLGDNALESIDGVEQSAALWKIDCSRNKIRCLDGLSKFIALGTLDLSSNQLDWSELRKIRRMIVVDLRLYGNPKLEKDPNYRLQVIDIFPNAWMLDGVLITASERKRVQAFFKESSSGRRPVRRRLGEPLFIPTHMKNLSVTGIFGERTTHMMKRFPANAVQTREIDERRLQYLAYDFQQELLLAARHLQQMGVRDVQPPPYVELLMDMRSGDQVERCNMFLLLLLVSIMFPLPHAIIESTLEVAKLVQIGPVECLPFFRLEPRRKLNAAFLLFNAIVLDRESGLNGGVYSTLYQSLKQATRTLLRVLPLKSAATPIHRIVSKSLSREALCLLSSEVVQLLCLVPAFYVHMDRELGLMELLVAATQNPSLPDKVRSIMWTERSDGVDGSVIQHQIASLLLQEMKDTSRAKSHSSYRTQTTTAKKRPFSSPTNTPMASASSPRARSSSPSRSFFYASRSSPKTPALGDSVVFGKEKLGRVVALPDSEVVLVQKTSGAVSPTNASQDEENYEYLSSKKLVWDTAGYWKPVGISAKTAPRTAWSSQSLLFSMSNLQESRQKLVETTSPMPSPSEARAKTLTRTDGVLNSHNDDPCPPPMSSPFPSTNDLVELQRQPSPAVSALPSRFSLRVDLQSASNIQPTESEAQLLSASTTDEEEKPMTITTTTTTTTTEESEMETTDDVTVPAPVTVFVPHDVVTTSSSNSDEDIHHRRSTRLSNPATAAVLSPRSDIELRLRLGLPVRRGSGNESAPAPAAVDRVWVAGESVRPVVIDPPLQAFRPAKLLFRRERKSDNRTAAASSLSSSLNVQATGRRISPASRPSTATSTSSAMRGMSATDPAVIKRQAVASNEMRFYGGGTSRTAMRRNEIGSSYRVPFVRKLGAVSIPRNKHDS